MPAPGWPSRLVRLLLSIGVFAAGMGAWGQTPQESAPDRSSSRSTSAGTLAPDEIVLKVGNTTVTVEQFEKMIEALPPQFAAALQALGTAGFVQQYASMLVLAQEGQRRKLDQGERFEQMVAFERLFLLSQLAGNALAESLSAPSTEDVQYYYTSRKQDFEQVRVRGIYIPFEPPAAPSSTPSVVLPPDIAQAVNPFQRLTEAQALAKARNLEQRLHAGESMDRVARQESQHPTASDGGDFGYVRRDQFETRVSNALFGLQTGRISAPIKDRSGYYLFRVESKRIQPLEEVRSLIENSLRQEKLSQLIGNLTKETPIEFNPKFFGTPTDTAVQGSR